MLNTSVARIICCFLFLVTKFEKTFSDNPPIVGPADIALINVLQCENTEKLPSTFVYEKRKFNRTTEIFDGALTLDTDLDENVDVHMNVAKWGDGGYKPNYVLFNYTNACKFFFEYLNRGIREILSGGGRPETCPIKKGQIIFKNHIFDSRDVPDELVYGNFKVTVSFVKDDKLVMCYVWFVETTMKSTLL